MSATPFFLAGFFDGPWLFLFIVLISAVANWLAKRRQDSAPTESGRESTGTPGPGAPSDWEERLRRLLGEELVPLPKPPATGLPRSAPPLRQPMKSTPPPVEVSPPARAEEMVSGHGVEETIRRFEKMDPGVMTPVRPIAARGEGRGSVLGARLRHRQAARDAFVATLVFGPPKGLEE